MHAMLGGCVPFLSHPALQQHSHMEGRGQRERPQSDGVQGRTVYIYIYIILDYKCVKSLDNRLGYDGRANLKKIRIL